MRHLRLVALPLLAVGLAAASTACAGSATCVSLEGGTFVALEEAPCGEEYCLWTIEFDDGFYHWRHDTVIENGEYECNGSTVEATGCYDMGGCTGTYDMESGVLTWEGMDYVVE